MQDPTQTPTSIIDQAGPPTDQQDEGQGIDQAISLVDGFLANPKAITPDALATLKADLEDLRSILEPDSAEPASEADPGAGLAGMIGQQMGGR